MVQDALPLNNQFQNRSYTDHFKNSLFQKTMGSKFHSFNEGRAKFSALTTDVNTPIFSKIKTSCPKHCPNFFTSGLLFLPGKDQKTIRPRNTKNAW